jgi:hypothetical protein
VDKTQHLCEPLSSLTDSEAVIIVIEQDNSMWYLIYKTYAIDTDVKSGEAEAIGEVLGELAIAIHYCPFCGKSLSDYVGPIN